MKAASSMTTMSAETLGVGWDGHNRARVCTQTTDVAARG